jgi:hypothetical protein
MNWKVFLAVGAIAGGVAVALRRRSRPSLEPTEQWADVTDPVIRFGDA